MNVRLDWLRLDSTPPPPIAKKDKGSYRKLSDVICICSCSMYLAAGASRSQHRLSSFLLLRANYGSRRRMVRLHAMNVIVDICNVSSDLLVWRQYRGPNRWRVRLEKLHLASFLRTNSAGISAHSCVTSQVHYRRNFFGQRKTKAICIVRGLNIDLRYVCPALFWNGSLRTSRRSCAIFERTMHSLGVHNHSIGLLELGLALMQAHMTQKPMLKIAKAIVQRADKIKLHTGHVHIHY